MKTAKSRAMNNTNSFNLFNGEKILFSQKHSRISTCWDVLFYVALLAVVIQIAPLLTVLPGLFHRYEWTLFASFLGLAFTVAVFYFRKRIMYKCCSNLFVLTNYRILQKVGLLGVVSLPYTNVEMREWKEDGLLFWFTPNRDSNGGRAHIQVSGLSEDEKCKVQELFFEGKARDLSGFQPLSTLTPNYEVGKEIGHLLQEHLPLLWYYKLPLASYFHPWLKVFALGLCIVCTLIVAGPGVTMTFGVWSGASLWLPCVIFIGIWLLIVMLVLFSTRVHFAITEKGLLKIKTDIIGACIESLGFDKVYPIYSFMNASQSNGWLDDYTTDIRSHSFQSIDGLELCGKEIVSQEEVIFRKYLDTLKDGANVVLKKE
eukprot:TRINITY_DN3308_c0_g5_i1.p1 TRINITY_DN3308_c0_g5~~TRINITY_DN3308_c0_g5_i1.p1  ORF type:complete len:372 (+),score=39.63 TRINITY_DN3308_c0_g5_i1:690-1805(+)